MRQLKFILSGIIFGIILTKSEAVSWFRIQEMFRFDSFHMYGIIGSAIGLGIIGLQVIKRKEGLDIDKNPIQFEAKERSVTRYLVGGIIFGLGWAMTGACPGPMFSLLGQGFLSLLIVIAGALIGTFIYGVLRPRLPH
jgi:uncharacterized membrane protein YedE/YeeE